MNGSSETTRETLIDLFDKDLILKNKLNKNYY